MVVKDDCHAAAILLRRNLVSDMHALGLKATEISAALLAQHAHLACALSVRMVRDDFQALGLSAFLEEAGDGGPDAEVTVAVARHLEEGHLALGRRLLQGRLIGDFDGERVQRRRIAAALGVLGTTNEPRRRISRHAWYEGVAPWFCVHMDQNEHIGFT
jgi:hypothetical protein